MSPPNDPTSPESLPLPSPPRPDLSQRYRLQMCFPEPSERERWDTINSFPSAIEALRGASECHETVKDLLGIGGKQELEPGFFKIRILDAEERRLVLWEDEAGRLIEEASAFEPVDAPLPAE